MIPIAVLDASVLYPATLRDLLMRLASALLFAPRLTDAIHEEWIRNVSLDRPGVTRAQLERTRALMDGINAQILVTGYERRIADLTLPDPDDRHVLAAALEAEASVIVTANLCHFPAKTLTPLGVFALHPDAFISGLFDADPSAVVGVVAQQRESLKIRARRRKWSGSSSAIDSPSSRCGWKIIWTIFDCRSKSGRIGAGKRL